MDSKRKLYVFPKHKHFFYSLILALVMGVILFKTTPTIIYAQKALQLAVSVAVQPQYKIQVQEDKLYITTNMTLYVNGKKINYR